MLFRGNEGSGASFFYVVEQSISLCVMYSDEYKAKQRRGIKRLASGGQRDITWSPSTDACSLRPNVALRCGWFFVLFRLHLFRWLGIAVSKVLWIKLVGYFLRSALAL